MRVELLARPLARLLEWASVTSLGESAEETALLLRAGVSNVEASNFVDAAGQRVLMCLSPALPADLPSRERMLTLAGHALACLWQKIGPAWYDTLDEDQPVLLVALPERFSAGGMSMELTPQGKDFVQSLRACLPAGLSSSGIEGFAFGRAAGALAMRRAIQLLNDGRRVIWGGVDTMADWGVLQSLERADRLLTQDNVDGVRPGEAAAFAALGAASGDGAVSVLGLGLGHEPCPVGSDPPCMSAGLSDALDAAVEVLRAARLRSNFWLLDTTHEAYGTQEVQNIIARFGDVLGTDADLDMPLKELGDVGAASLPLLSVLGAQAWRFSLGKDDTAVLTASSDHGARGAMLLAPAVAPRPAAEQP